MLRNQISRIRNIFALCSRLQALRLIFKPAACSLWRAAICAIIFLSTFSIFSFAQDKIAAIVNNDVITQKDLNDFINFMRIQLYREYKGEELESKIQSMKLDLLDKLIEDSLILQEAKKENIKIDPNRIRARIDEIRKRYPSESEFQDALDKQGLVQADIESKIREQLLTYAIIESKIRSKLVVNPAEVTGFYQENMEKFKSPEERQFESAAIDNKNLVKEIFNNLKDGQKLEDVADKHSLRINKLSSKGDGKLRKDIEEIIFKLNLGQVSGPIKIEDNFYFFKLNNIKPSRQQNLLEVQDSIYGLLFDKKIQEGLQKWLDELKRNAYIKIFSN